MIGISRYDCNRANQQEILSRNSIAKLNQTVVSVYTVVMKLLNELSVNLIDETHRNVSTSQLSIAERL